MPKGKFSKLDFVVELVYPRPYAISCTRDFLEAEGYTKDPILMLEVNGYKFMHYEMTRCHMLL